ncbi:MAG: hypothetical protein EOP84_02840 [Verrucomicrobiaceae bacterium]|nr:MAG: hypothetical protein EOP84_02840 [Verrucomicrobiaceae bacterium]
MDGNPSEFRSTMVRAKALGRALLQVYRSDESSTPPELLELLDIAEERLESAGYAIKGPHAYPRY